MSSVLDTQLVRQVYAEGATQALADQLAADVGVDVVHLLG
jgi:hypothetical protein